MKEYKEQNPYYRSSSMQTQAFPWLYPAGFRMDPYANWMNYRNLWDSPERMEDEMDDRRLRELYPIMARRMQPYVEKTCDRLEYPGSMMYDEYPDQLSLLRKAKEAWQAAKDRENFGDNPPEWEDIQDLVGVLLLQEMMRRRKKNRGKMQPRIY